MISNPFVSVIIPNYNHANYLDERILSVLNQTYQNFEVIILDDKSTDNSVDVINKYKDNPNVSQIVINEKNSGKIFSQWHKGFELAKGDIIWVAESDDYCDIHFLEKMVRAMSQRKDCVIAFCKIIAFNEDDVRWAMTPKKLKEGMYDGSSFITEFMSEGTTIVNVSGAIFKKSAVNSIKDDYTNYIGAGDRLFWTELAEKGAVSFVDEPLCFFRLHSNNSTKRNYLNGTNQREDKLILDYIYRKEYIDKSKYNQLRKDYIIRKVLYIRDTSLRKNLLKVWTYGPFDRSKLLLWIYSDILMTKVSDIIHCFRKNNNIN